MLEKSFAAAGFLFDFYFFEFDIIAGSLFADGEGVLCFGFAVKSDCFGTFDFNVVSDAVEISVAESPVRCGKSDTADMDIMSASA